MMRVCAAGATALASIGSVQANSTKERMVIGYEERIRKFSTPEKNFSVFASVAEGGTLQMTPFDFVKSLMHYDETAKDRINANPPKCFAILDTDSNGLLSFTECVLPRMLLR